MSEHYATDVPRYTRIVSPEEHGGVRLAGAIIEKVHNWHFVAGTIEMDLTTDDGETFTVTVPVRLRLTVETTALRTATLGWASRLVAEGPESAGQHPTLVRSRPTTRDDGDDANDYGDPSSRFE